MLKKVNFDREMLKNALDSKYYKHLKYLDN